MKVFINVQLKMFTIVTLVDLHPIFNTFTLFLSSQLPPPYTLHHAPSSPPHLFTLKPSTMYVESTCVPSSNLSTKVLFKKALTNAQSSWSPTGGQPATDQSSTGDDSRGPTDRSPCGTWTDLHSLVPARQTTLEMVPLGVVGISEQNRGTPN